MKEPVDHILRPTLPWRSTNDGAITECGYDASKVSTLTREQYFARLKDYGQQRTAMCTCMTCANTAQRWGTWEDDPRLAVEREIQWEQPQYRRYADQRGQRMKDELLAIAALIEAHPEEFAAAVAAVGARREWNARKEESRQKAAIVRPKPPGL